MKWGKIQGDSNQSLPREGLCGQLKIRHLDTVVVGIVRVMVAEAVQGIETVNLEVEGAECV